MNRGSHLAKLRRSLHNVRSRLREWSRLQLSQSVWSGLVASNGSTLTTKGRSSAWSMWPPPVGLFPWIGVVVAAVALGAGVARTPLLVALVLAALAAIVGAHFALARPRWFLVITVFLVASYIPDALEARISFPFLTKSIVVLVAMTMLVRRGLRLEKFEIPTETTLLIAIGVAMSLAGILSRDHSAAAASLFDYIAHGSLALLLMILIDSREWLRRAMWAFASAGALLGFLAIVQQFTKTYGVEFGGLAAVDPQADYFRSAGPLSPNYFGQMLGVACIFALYLCAAERRTMIRVGGAAACIICLAAAMFTYSRGSLLALMLVLVVVALLRGARVWMITCALVVAVIAGSILLGNDFKSRLGSLAVSLTSGPEATTDTAIRGRASEAVAAVQMWIDHPYLGVGPGNYAQNYQDYSGPIGLDSRTELREAHNLYLEALAELGLLGAIPLLSVLGIALVGSWQLRRRTDGTDRLLAEGVFVAMLAFMISSLTLHMAYTRYLWMVVGLSLAARRLSGVSARSAFARMGGEGGART